MAGRPRSRPNYNFIRQLQVFSECNYNPSEGAAPYIAWKKRQDLDQTYSLRVIDGMPVIPDRLFLSLCVSPLTLPPSVSLTSFLLQRLSIEFGPRNGVPGLSRYHAHCLDHTRSVFRRRDRRPCAQTLHRPAHRQRVASPLSPAPLPICGWRNARG